MDQKIMDFLAKIYQTQTEMRNELRELRTDQETIAQNVAKIVNVVEHDVDRKIGAIFDFREIQVNHNQKIEQALDRIEAKVEVLQLETSNLKRIK
ncbi:hypothetical protein [Desulfosporosinus sp. OT]|uniref:hypothetical protein n=1 Tax=Desulfosporosinus sp. OT TaxID=913865 RepID=UPI000223A2E0|nr:hypothetical protein [Desulfosporosinus sp. OT]EGW38517.1 hypothetical protein DOT_3580 [Desulfosporosinus sp. OT]